MLSLLKADLFRIAKSKLTFISLIIASTLPILMVLLYYGLGKLDEEGYLAQMFSARMLMASVFSLSDNVGLVICVFSAIFVSMDLANGTLRNKVIAGHSRSSIYLSHVVASVIYNVIVISVYAGLTLLFGSLILGFGGDMSSEEIKSFVFSMVTGMTTFVYVATISSFFGLVVGSVAPSIIFTVLFCLLLSLVTGVVSLIDYSNFKYIVYFIPTFANGNALGVTVVDNTLFIEAMVSYGAFSVLNVFLGIVLFTKKDLK